MNKLPNNVAEIIVVTYDSDKARVERRLFIEEEEDGKVDLILRVDAMPKRVDGDDRMWVTTVPDEKEDIE